MLMRAVFAALSVHVKRDVTEGEVRIADCQATGESLVRRFPCREAGRGPMAEWLRRGLQILARRFDSGSGLHDGSAALAQLVEHIIRNDGVTCSSHVSGTTPFGR